jgi:hypothetical protein
MEGSSIDNGIYLLSASSSWMDVLEALESGMTRSEGGGTQPRTLSSPGVLQMLSICRRLASLLVTVIGSLDVSPVGDDSTRSRHL